jgi:hypothetical protein
MNEEIRFLCTKGFCKLFFLDIIEYPSILATLIVELFHPLTLKFKTDQACLRSFFPAYANSPKHQASLEQAFHLVVSLILDASEGSSMNQIKLVDLAGFFFPLLLPAPTQHDVPYDVNIHKRIAKKFLSLISSSPLGRAPRELSPILLKLTLQPGASTTGVPKTPKKGDAEGEKAKVPDESLDKEGKELIYDCRVLVEKALNFVVEKHAKTNLEKFKSRLEALDPSPLKQVCSLSLFLCFRSPSLFSSSRPDLI